MTLRNRFLLIGTGLVIFFIASPLLVLFARGYKIDFKNWEIQKTGTLIIRSEPSRADILLNGKKQNPQTPATLRFLLPADYILTVEKPDYQSWTKRLTVNSELVTWANLSREFVALFYKDARFKRSIETQAVFKNPDNTRLLYLDKDASHFIDARDDSAQLIGNSPAWPAIKETFRQYPERNLFYILGAGRELALNRLPEIKKIEVNSDFTVMLTGTTLQALDSQNRPLTAVENVVDFHLEDRSVWILESGNLRRIDLRNNGNEVIRQSLPISPNSTIIRGNGHVFLLIDGTLYAVNDKIERIYDPVTSAYWDNQGKKLVYANSHEVFILEPDSLRSELILRSSTEIAQVALNSETGYVLFANEGKIKAVELDGRDHRNVYTITDAMSGFLLSENGKLIHVYSDQEIKTLEIR